MYTMVPSKDFSFFKHRDIMKLPINSKHQHKEMYENILTYGGLSKIKNVRDEPKKSRRHVRAIACLI